MNAELLNLLCCPETHQTFSVAPPALIEQLNQRIARGGLINRAGRMIVEKIDDGLLRADGRFLYPVRASIPILLIDEAIAVPVEN
ncbi:MAG: hypothetical protein HY043_02510 [Verrucomicrobia bacterium]|nr:hypothetical protein [Verrucomicrobiota bacterium]